MKILAICSCLDIAQKEIGVTPAWWQILKGLHELGVEVITIPYYGNKVESLWWTAYENPNLWKSKAYNLVERVAQSLPLYKDKMEFRQRNQNMINFSVRKFTLGRWKKYLRSVIQKEKDVDAVIFFTIPLNQFAGIPTIIKKEYGIPVICYDGDAPASLPSYGGLSFSYYIGADPSEYDAFIITSKGVVDEIKKLGAKRIFTVHWGVDPGVFSPINGIKQEIDVGFYGIGSKLREKWIRQMLVRPSLKLPEVKFAICGTAFNVELGSVKLVSLDNCSYRRFSCQTKINLNIVRKPHAETNTSSISRIYELASLGCCIISNPYKGIEEWFDIGKEVIVANDGDEAIELYSWLLSDEETRLQMGKAARQRVLKEHTHKHRARQLLSIFKGLK